MPSFFARHLKVSQDLNISLDFIKDTTQLFSDIDGLEQKSKTTLAWISCISLLTFITAWLWTHLSFLGYCFIFKTWRPKTHIAYKVLSDSPMDKLLFEASHERSDTNVLMLTMPDRKVYVGKIITMGEPNELEGPDQEVTMLPVMSGYRQKDTLAVIFTNQYEQADRSVRVILRQDMIISATRFSFDTYEQLNPVIDKPKVRVTESAITQVYICQSNEN